MALIRGASSGIDADVDATPKAIRVIQYDQRGGLVYPGSDGKFSAPVWFRATAAATAGALVWAMRVNPAQTKSVYISRAMLNVGFDGTAVAASSSAFELVRFSGATPTGGTAVPVVKTDTASPASIVTDARVNQAGALTITGVTQDSPFYAFGIPRSVSGGSIGAEAFENEDAVRLAPGEGIAIRAAVATVIGDTINGRFGWEER